MKHGVIFEKFADLCQCDADIEMLVIKLELSFTRDIYVKNVNRPPSGNVDRFVKAIQNCITLVRNNRDSDIFIGGDINVDMLHPNSTNAKRIQKLIRINQLK